MTQSPPINLFLSVPIGWRLPNTWGANCIWQCHRFAHARARDASSLMIFFMFSTAGLTPSQRIAFICREAMFG